MPELFELRFISVEYTGETVNRRGHCVATNYVLTLHGKEGDNTLVADVSFVLIPPAPGTAYSLNKRRRWSPFEPASRSATNL